MNILHGYHLGTFILEADRCLKSSNIAGLRRSVEKFLPNARDIEQAIFEQLKEDAESGKNSA